MNDQNECCGLAQLDIAGGPLPRFHGQRPDWVPRILRQVHRLALPPDPSAARVCLAIAWKLATPQKHGVNLLLRVGGYALCQSLDRIQQSTRRSVQLFLPVTGKCGSGMYTQQESFSSGRNDQVCHSSRICQYRARSKGTCKRCTAQ